MRSVIEDPTKLSTHVDQQCWAKSVIITVIVIMNNRRVVTSMNMTTY